MYTKIPFQTAEEAHAFLKNTLQGDEWRAAFCTGLRGEICGFHLEEAVARFGADMVPCGGFDSAEQADTWLHTMLEACLDDIVQWLFTSKRAIHKMTRRFETRVGYGVRYGLAPKTSTNTLMLVMRRDRRLNEEQGGFTPYGFFVSVFHPIPTEM